MTNNPLNFKKTQMIAITIMLSGFKNNPLWNTIKLKYQNKDI